MTDALGVSGDGPSNDGDPISVAKSRAIEEVSTINGLPITIQEFSLGDYHISNVVGAPDSSVISISGYEQFGLAILRKLVREIAGTGAGSDDGGSRLSEK